MPKTHIHWAFCDFPQNPDHYSIAWGSMAEAAAQIEIKKPSFIVTLPGYNQAHHCYSSYVKDKYGRIKPRPVIASDEREHADLIHTAMWSAHSDIQLLFSGYIDCDHGRCLNKNLVKGKISAEKLRGRLVDELGSAAKYVKLVRSKSGRGIHAWYFFSAIPIDGKEYDVLDMARKVQKAMQMVLEDFGADPNASGLMRWGTNWKNSQRAIDDDIDEFQKSVRKAKTRVLRILLDALKVNPRTREVFEGPLKRFYPDARVNRKILEFVISNRAALERGEDLVMRTKDILPALGISKNTLPELLSSPVGTSTSSLRGIRLERDLERRGYYRVSATEELYRLRHLIQKTIEDKAKRKSRAGAAGQAIEIFVPTTRPESVLDGDRNRALSHVYLKLKWHGCELETAHRIVAAYVARMPEGSSSNNARRFKQLGINIYSRLKDNHGCKPGLAEDWLTSLASNSYRSKAVTSCPKSPKGELQCSAPRQEKKTPPTQLGQLGVEGVGNTASVSGGTGGSVVSMDDWKRRGSVRGVVRNLARVMDLKSSPERSTKAERIVGRKLQSDTKSTDRKTPITKRVAELIMSDNRWDKFHKASMLEKLTPLIALGSLTQETLQLLRTLWPREPFDYSP